MGFVAWHQSLQITVKHNQDTQGLKSLTHLLRNRWRNSSQIQPSSQTSSCVSKQERLQMSNCKRKKFSYRGQKCSSVPSEEVTEQTLFKLQVTTGYTSLNHHIQSMQLSLACCIRGERRSYEQSALCTQVTLTIHYIHTVQRELYCATDKFNG